MASRTLVALFTVCILHSLVGCGGATGSGSPSLGEPTPTNLVATPTPSPGAATPSSPSTTTPTGSAPPITDTQAPSITPTLGSVTPSATTREDSPTPTVTPTSPPTPIETQRAEGYWEHISGDATTLTLPIPGHVVLSGEAGGGLLAVDPVAEWGETPGAAPETLYLGAYLGSGKALLGGEGGSYVAEGARVVASGLDGALGGPITALVATQYGSGIEDVWLRAQGALFLLSGGGSLKRYELGGLPIQQGVLVWGPSVETSSGEAIPGAALWVASGDDIYGLTLAEGGALSAWPRPLGGAAIDIATAGSQLYALGPEGRLWVLDGALWRLLPTELRFQGLSGRFGAEGLWLLGDGGGLHRYHPGDGIHSLEGSPLNSDGDLLGVDDQGRGFVSASVGVYRVSLGRPLFIHGLDPGERLDTLTTLTLLPTTSGESVTLEVEVDGAPLSSGEGEALSFTLSPLNLEAGSHRLAAVARYADGYEAHRELDFSSIDATPPTWGEDIELIFKQSCAQCHGEGAFAHALYTPESWEEEIESILIQVEAGAMPLGADPLTSSEIDRIRVWAETGFGR